MEIPGATGDFHLRSESSTASGGAEDSRAQLSMDGARSRTY